MKGKSLKLWQAILLIFSTVFVATGGVVLYTYLTTGFAEQKVKPEEISFKVDENFNSVTGQYEVDSSFNMLITATNEDVTETKLTLSFENSLSTFSDIVYSEIIKDGVKYISNGIIIVPQVVDIGTPFTVELSQRREDVEGTGYYVNVGGISTLVARYSDELEPVEAKANIAVDVPVEAITVDINGTTSSMEESTGNIIVLQSSNFDIGVNYYPSASRYRYSDNLYAAFYGVAKDPRVKDYCFDSEDVNILKHYNDGDIYFTSTNLITKDNKVTVYVFKTAKAEEVFEKSTALTNGEVYYNTMLAHLVSAEAKNKVQKDILFNIEQAKVGSLVVSNKEFTAYTNKALIISVNSNTYGDENLALTIADQEGANLASTMTSQLGIRVRYKKTGENFVELKQGDNTVVVVGAQGQVYLGARLETSPYLFGGTLTTDNSIVEGKTYYTKNERGNFEVVETPTVAGLPNYYENVYTYFLIDASARNLNEANWTIATSETSLEIELQVVLFMLDENGNLQIFDEAHNADRVVEISVTEYEEGEVDWLGDKNLSRTIVYSDGQRLSGTVNADEILGIPTSNVYKRARYYVAFADGTEVTTSEVNIVNGKIIQVLGVTYYLVDGETIRFKEAGIYNVVFVTIKTDAFGRIIDDEGKDIIVKTSGILSVEVNETLQAFANEKIDFNNKQNNATIVETEDETPDGEKIYYIIDALGDIQEWTGATFAAGTTYYEAIDNQPYFALPTGSEDIVLEFQVGEADIELLKDEEEAGRFRVYAVSSNRHETSAIEFQLEILSIEEKSEDEKNIAIITLKIPEGQTIVGEDKKGEGFFLQLRYFNTVVDTYTDVEVSNYPATKYGRQSFMIYTPTPGRIVNNDLSGKTFEANVAMNNNGQYEICEISGGDLPDKIDKDDFNALFESTEIYDVYERPMSSDLYTVSVPNTTSSIYVQDKQLQFGSGTEDVVVTVSAGDESFSFIIKTKSSGVKSVSVGGETFDATHLSNITYETLGKENAEIAIKSIITVKVGNDISLEDAYKFVYVKNGNDSDLLSLLDFYDNNDVKITSDLYTQQITKIVLKENLYAQGTLNLVISNKDYSIDENNETLKLDVKVIFTSNVEKPGTDAISETMITNDLGNLVYADSLTDGVYAGFAYDLDNFIPLTDKDPDTTPENSKLSWTGSSYFENATKYYILTEGNTSTNESDKDSAVGEIFRYDSKLYIKFYDVTGVVERRTVKLFYNIRNDTSTGNPLCYFADVDFKIYPNITLSKATAAAAKEKINLLYLSNKGQDSIGNYLAVSRIRGTETITSVSYAIVGASEHDSLIVDGGYFDLNSSYYKALDYAKLEYEIQVQLKYNNINLTNANGEDVTYALPVEVGTDMAYIANVLKKNGSVNMQRITYNGVDAFLVNAGNNLYTRSDGDAAANTYPDTTSDTRHYFEIGRYETVYAYGSTNIGFRASTNGLLFNDRTYLLLNVRSGKIGNIVAQLKVPIVVSTVGSTFANYTNSFYQKVENPVADDIDKYYKYNAGVYTGGLAAFDKNETYYILLNDDLYTMLNGTLNYSIAEENETKVAPYEVLEAGTTYRLSYRNAIVPGVFGLYYDENVTITSVSFENQDRELGTIYQDGDGFWCVQFANYANEERFINLRVVYSQAGGASDISFTYRILLQPNITTQTIYPFGEDSTAEFVTLNEDATYDLSGIFGSYAGTKADKKRFNISIGSQDYQDSVDYYVRTSDMKAVVENEKLTLEVGAVLIDNNLNNLFTTTKALLIESYQIETVGGYECYKITLTSMTYIVKNLTFKENSSNGDELDFSNSGIDYDELESGNYTVSAGNLTYYLIVDIAANGTKTFTLNLNNSTPIMTISLTSAGVLSLTQINSDYFVGIEIEKTFAGVVNGDLTYNFRINDGSGVYYIDYGVSSQDPQVVTMNYSEFTSGKNVIIKYTNSAGSASQEITEESGITAITSATELRDRNGEVVTYKTVTVTISGASISRKTITVKISGTLDQDYTLTVYFSSSNSLISTLILNVPSEVVIDTVNSNDFYGGKNIRDTINSNYVFKKGLNTINVTNVEVMNATNCLYVDANGNLTCTDKDINSVALDLKLTYSGGFFYKQLSINILKNVGAVASINKTADEIYAGENLEFDMNDGDTKCFNLLAESSLDLTKVEASFSTASAYFEEISFNKTTGVVTLTTRNVERDVDVTVGVRFTYTFASEKYSFSWVTSVRARILANTIWTVNYPNPEEIAGGSNLTGESVLAGKNYKQFFNSVAPFVSDNTKRVVATPAKEGVDIDLSDAVVTIKSISNATVTQVDNNGVQIENTVVANADNYLDFSCTGLDNNFKFGLTNSQANGTIVFEITLNNVKVEYSVYVFADIYVETKIVDTVSTAEGIKNNVFVEQLSEGTIFNSNMLAKVTMDETLQAGAYYLKIKNYIDCDPDKGLDPINPYLWVGFYYEANGENPIYVLIGQRVKNGELSKKIIGIFSDKLSNTPVSATIELSAFVTLEYKTLNNGAVENHSIVNYENYTTLGRYQNGDGEEKVLKPLIKISGNYYYVDTSTTPATLKIATGITDANIDGARYVQGEYQAYTDKFTISGNDVYTSDSTRDFGSSWNTEELEKTGDYYKYQDEEKEVDIYLKEVSVNKFVKNQKETGNYFKPIGYLNSGSYVTTEEITETNADAQYIIIHDAYSNGYYYVQIGSNANIELNAIADKYTYKEQKTATGLEPEDHVVVTAHVNTMNTVVIDGGEYFTDAAAGDNYEYNHAFDIYEKTSGQAISLGGEQYSLYKQRVVGTDIYYLTGFTNYTIGSGKVVNYTNAMIVNGATSLSQEYLLKDYQNNLSGNARILANRVVADNAGSTMVQNPSDGTYYLVNSETVCGATPEYHYYAKTGVQTIYRTETKLMDISSKAISSVIIDGVGFTKVQSGQYVKIAYDDVNIRRLDAGVGETYFFDTTKTFSITSVSSSTIGDTISVRFYYVIDEIIDSFDLEFTLDVDFEVLNAYDSDNANSYAQTISYGEETYNYIEIETNKDYDFNQIVGVIRSSTGQVISTTDVLSTSEVSLKVVTEGTEYELAHTILGDELKTNEDVIRFAFELVKNGNTNNSTVYNFNIRARGADNNGDYVLVEYTYKMNIKQFAFGTSEGEYTVVKYVLFKLVSDYQVTMYDTVGNILMLTPEEDKVSNIDNIARIEDFAVIGEIVDTGKTLYDKYTDGGPTKKYNLDPTNTGNGEVFKYKYGFGQSTSASFNDSYTAIIYNNSETYYISTLNIDQGTNMTKEDANAVKVYTNVDIIAASKGSNGLVKVTSKNAVDSMSSITAQAFNATLSANVASDVDNYLDLNYSSFKMYSPADPTEEEYMANKSAYYIIGATQCTLASAYNGDTVYYQKVGNNYVGKKLSQETFNANKTDYYTLTAVNNIANYQAAAQYYTLSYTVLKNNDGVKIKISKEVGLGERNFTLTFVDNYGYTVVYKFVLVASSNPTFARGKTTFTEGKPFDIGSLYEEVSIDSWETTNDYYYKIDGRTDGAIFRGYNASTDEGKDRYKNVGPEIDSLTKKTVDAILFGLDPTMYYKVSATSQNGQEYDSTKKYYTKSGNNYYAQSITEGQFDANKSNYYVLTITRCEPTESYSSGTSYYTINYAAYASSATGGYVIDASTGGAYFLIDEDISATDTSSKFYLSDSDGSKYTIVTPSVAFKISSAYIKAKSTSTVIKNPVINPSGKNPENGNETITNSDIVILSGINAFGFTSQNVDAGSAIGEYFKTGSDLNKLKITNVAYIYNGKDLGVSITPKGGLENLASSNAPYQYKSSDKMGRYATANYTTPTLPGYVYGDADSVELTMRLTIENESETYLLNIPIVVTKADERIISSTITNIADGTSFAVKNHFEFATGQTNNFTIYDDTIAVTLPPKGQVTMTITATPSVGTALQSSVVLQSNSDVDTTQYVGISRTLGKTLDDSYGISVSFTNYDTNKVTREGHFGFYASYANGTVSEKGDNGTVSGTWKAVHGYGQIEYNGAIGQFTLVEKDDTKIYIPTDFITDINGDRVISYKTGTSYVTSDTGLTTNVTSVVSMAIGNIQPLNNDCLHLVDMKNLTQGKERITKYYIAKYSDNKFYQVVKTYDVYPTFFQANSTDYNNDVEATAQSDNKTFLFGSWANQVQVTAYTSGGDAGTSAKYLNAAGIDKAQFYFELGRNDTTSATINRSTGVITIDGKKTDGGSYELNGQEYITVYIYIKASGETGQYIDDNLTFSGNNYNTPLVTIRVYLKAHA